MLPTETAVIATIRDFIGRRLLHGDDAHVADDAPLVALGILDSASTVMLITFLEEAFGVTVPADVDLSEVETIASIARLVERLAVAA